MDLSLSSAGIILIGLIRRTPAIPASACISAKDRQASGWVTGFSDSVLKVYMQELHTAVLDLRNLCAHCRRIRGNRVCHGNGTLRASGGQGGKQTAQRRGSVWDNSSQSLAGNL